jgi:3-oxoacyl-[acyl-carrier-protein] synthase-1/3-oxoacyl-[acyl-carrier-protein] synthase II
MVLGDGAAFVALAPESPDAIGHITGFGASGDAVHLTAPDRDGAGLVRSAERALASAKMDASQIDLVSAHATSTPFNDAAESRAIRRVFGARARDVPVHAFKAQIGHTLGAAGVLETLVMVDAIARGVAPASVVFERDPDAAVCLLPRAEARPIRAALKLSAAFGGATAALVLAKEPSSPGGSRTRTVYVGRAAHVVTLPNSVELAGRLGLRSEKVGRACELTHLALAAAAELDREGLRGAGVVVGHAYATVDVNNVYYARIGEKGARHAEPHRFPYTTPAAVAGELSLAFGLTGPNLTVGGGLHGALEALCVAADLVSAGDADRMLVVATDAPGPAARAIAAGTGWPLPRLGAVALVVGSDESIGRPLASWECSTDRGSRPDKTIGHAALLSLVHGNPTEIVISSPQGSCHVRFA